MNVEECIKISCIDVKTDTAYSCNGEEFITFDLINGNIDIEGQVIEEERIKNLLSEIERSRLMPFL